MVPVTETASDEAFCTAGGRPVAAGFTQRVASELQGVQVRQAAQQALDGRHLQNCVARHVQVVQLLQGRQGADVCNVAVLQRQPCQALSKGLHTRLCC